MKPQPYPILEFDSNKEAIINPDFFHRHPDVPEICIFPFYKHVLNDLFNQGILTKLTEDASLVTDPLPLYEFTYKEIRIAVMTPGLGASFAAAMLEFAIAQGCRKFIVIGSCGVLDKTIPRDQLILPTHAIRDEGTSYHYMSPSREVAHDPMMLALLKDYLTEKDVKFTEAKTWTTDAFYRETPLKIQRRRQENAIAVEMEAAALMAVAQFRNVSLGYLLAAGDDVSGLEWDHRNLMSSLGFHEQFFWLAADICTHL